MVGPFAIGCERNGKPSLAAASQTFFHQRALDLASAFAEIRRNAVTNVRFVIQISKGLIRQQRTRRLMMFYGVLVALVLLFAGSTLLWPVLRERPFVFLAYWAVCAWITILAVLLAIYDIFKVRTDARRALRQIAEDATKSQDDARDEDSR